MRPSKRSQGRIHKKRRWWYEWEAKEVVVVAQGLFGMKRTMRGKREVGGANKGVEE
jgi:hypothetical protein